MANIKIRQYDKNKHLLHIYYSVRQAALHTGLSLGTIGTNIYSKEHFNKKTQCYFLKDGDKFANHANYELGQRVIADNFRWDRITYRNIAGTIIKVYENSVCLDISETDSMPENIKIQLCRKIVVSKDLLKGVGEDD